MSSRSLSTQSYSEDKHLPFNTCKFYFQQKLGGLKLDPKATILEMWGWVLGGANNGCLGPAVPTARTSAKPGQTGGRVWHGRGAMVTEQISTEKGYKNEAIVWPKWSTPGKEWHIQTVIQAYCCDRPAECFTSTVYPAAGSAAFELYLRTQRSDTSRSSRKQCRPQVPLPKSFQGLHRVNIFF